jgi:hypothetical protein
MRAQTHRDDPLPAELLQNCRQDLEVATSAQSNLSVACGHGLHSRQGSEPLGVDGIGALELHELHLTQTVDQLSWASLRDEPALIHDRDAIAKRRGLFHVMGREHDGPAGLSKPLDHPPQ